jgi:hypothetical protein
MLLPEIEKSASVKAIGLEIVSPVRDEVKALVSRRWQTSGHDLFVSASKS